LDKNQIFFTFNSRLNEGEGNLKTGAFAIRHEAFVHQGCSLMRLGKAAQLFYHSRRVHPWVKAKTGGLDLDS
jgi:hypothetical protein